MWAVDGWTPDRVAERPTGRREGWWGLPPASEAFLDELVTWRELGYGFCFHRADYAEYGSLPNYLAALGVTEEQVTRLQTVLRG